MELDYNLTKSYIYKFNSQFFLLEEEIINKNLNKVELKNFIFNKEFKKITQGVKRSNYKWLTKNHLKFYQGNAA